MEAFGPVYGFLYSWISTLILKPSGLAIMTLAFAQYTLHPILTLFEMDNESGSSNLYVRWAENLLSAATISKQK